MAAGQVSYACVGWYLKLNPGGVKISEAYVPEKDPAGREQDPGQEHRSQHEPSAERGGHTSHPSRDPRPIPGHLTTRTRVH